MQTKSKLLFVESIRGFACFMVVLHHLSLTFFPFIQAFSEKPDFSYNKIQFLIHESPFGFLFSGTAAIFVFFVLSGFILTKVALREKNTPLIIFSMGLKRYPRLMIPALASCLLAYIFFYFLDISTANVSGWMDKYGNFDYSLTGAIYSGMIDVFFLSGASQYNTVLWTMQIELIGSIFIYLLCINKMFLKIRFLSGVSLILIAILVMLKAINIGLGYGLASFYGGYLFCIYGRKVSLRMALFMAVIGFYLAGVHYTVSYSYVFIYGFLGDNSYVVCNFLSGFFIVYAIIFSEKLNSLFSGKVMVFMGKVSFSVYLIHIPIISTLGVQSFNLLYASFGFDFSAIVASIITIIAIYIGAVFFYKAVDSQGMLFSNYFAKKTTAWMSSLSNVIGRSNR